MKSAEQFFLTTAFAAIVVSLAACSANTAAPAAYKPTLTGQSVTKKTQMSVGAATAAASSYDGAVLALSPAFYYETTETSGAKAFDATSHANDGTYVAPFTLNTPGPCCENAAVALSDASGGSGKVNAQITSPLAGSNATFNKPFAIGLATNSTVAYPGYGTFYFAGTDITENGAGYGWDFDYGNNNVTGTASYNVNWRYGANASSEIEFTHSLLMGWHYWNIVVTMTNVYLYLDGAQISSSTISGSFQVAAGRANLSFGNNAEIDKSTFNCACSISSVYLVPNALTSSQVSTLYADTRATPAPSPSPTPIVSASPSAGPSGLPVSYNASTACINQSLFNNTVLPGGVGEFATSGFNTSYWGGSKSRTYAPASTWGPGYYQSWGRHQYDTNFGDPSQGSSFPNPFAIVNDQGTQALQIAAYPVPSPVATSLSLMNNDQYIVANATQNITVPNEGGGIMIDVDNPNGAQTGWKVGIGYSGAPNTFIGTLTSGGATPSGNGTGGSNPWTISNIHVYSGTAGTVLVPSSNPNAYAFRSYAFPDYYSGVLDTDVNQQYGFFVARVRLPQPLPGLSPAFWMLETGGVGSNNGQLLRSEWDIEEQFANNYGYRLNAGNILWNSGNSGPWYSYGCGMTCGANNTTISGSTGVYPWPSNGNYNSGYHDYGVLVQPGGPAFPTDYSGSKGGDYVENNSPWVGTTFFVDGYPVAGHVGQPDLTQGSPDKEIMLMFQIAAPGTFLDPNGQAKSNPWPQYMYVQWLRAYKSAGTSCR